jgi:hypothetical protein
VTRNQAAPAPRRRARGTGAYRPASPGGDLNGEAGAYLLALLVVVVLVIGPMVGSTHIVYLLSGLPGSGRGGADQLGGGRAGGRGGRGRGPLGAAAVALGLGGGEVATLAGEPRPTGRAEVAARASGDQSPLPDLPGVLVRGYVMPVVPVQCFGLAGLAGASVQP